MHNFRHRILNDVYEYVDLSDGVLDMFFKLIDRNFDEVKCYAVCIPDLDEYASFIYKVAFVHDDFKKVLKFDTAGYQFILKSDLNKKIKDGLMKEIDLDELLLSWGSHYLHSGRLLEKKMMSKLGYPTKEQIESLSEDECWSTDPRLCLIGRDYETLEPIRSSC